MLSIRKLDELTEFQRANYAKSLNAIIIYILEEEPSVRETYKEFVYQNIETSSLCSEDKKELFKFFQKEIEDHVLVKG